MAKRRGRNGYQNENISNISNRRLFDVLSLIRPLRDLQLIEDRRQFHPEGVLRPARTLYERSASRNVVAPAKKFSPAISFAVPAKVALCVRRKQRREVLFATGKGGGRHKRPRKNLFSNVRCT